MWTAFYFDCDRSNAKKRYDYPTMGCASSKSTETTNGPDEQPPRQTRSSPGKTAHGGAVGQQQQQQQQRHEPSRAEVLASRVTGRRRSSLGTEASSTPGAGLQRRPRRPPPKPSIRKLSNQHEDKGTGKRISSGGETHHDKSSPPKEKVSLN